MSLRSLQWDKGLLRFFDIPVQILPKIKSSAEIYGYISTGSLLGVPIAGVSFYYFYPSNYSEAYRRLMFFLCLYFKVLYVYFILYLVFITQIKCCVWTIYITVFILFLIFNIQSLLYVLYSKHTVCTYVSLADM